MKIVMTHNYYQQRGGEDAVFEAEAALLEKRGHAVERLIFRNDGIQSRVERIQAGLRSFYNTESARELNHLLDQFSPDVLHVHNSFPLASPAILIEAKRRNLPVVMTLHNYRLLCANALLFRDGQVCEACIPQAVPLSGIQHACYRGSRVQSATLAMMTTSHRWLGTWRKQVDCYITLTEFARRKFVDANLGFHAEQFSVKPNFIDDYGVGDVTARESFFLFVGRLSPEKGLENVLEAFRQRPFPLKIIGSGPLEATVQEMAAAYPDIEYLGFMDQASIRAVMKKARALIFPSIWYEGFPMVILEALSTGTPVLASRIGGLPEIIQHQGNGLLMLPGSVNSIQETIAFLSAEDSLHGSLCLNARGSYLSRYTPELNYEALVSTYHRVLKAEKQT